MSFPSFDSENQVKWIACGECEAPCRERKLPAKSVLQCGRCGMVVRRSTDEQALQAAWAFASTGLLLVLLANVYPILTFDVAGNTQSNLIVTGVFGLFHQGYWPIALLVFFAGVAGPGLHLAAVWYVLAGCCLGVRLPGLRQAAVVAEALEGWNLVPVYMVATVVAVVKLDMLGTVNWQIGAVWVLALGLCSLLTVQFFDRDLVGERVKDLA